MQGQYYQDIIGETVKRFPTHSIVEIGTDGGATARLAMQAMKGFAGWFFTIDPYGDKPYKVGDDIQGKNMQYNDRHYHKTVASLYQYAAEHEINYLHWKLTSLDWMKIWNQVEFWNDGNKGLKFSLAYLDGDHSWNPVEQEFNYFYSLIPRGGYIVIDDYNLLGGEEGVRRTLTQKGKWYFNETDDHYRCYFQK